MRVALIDGAHMVRRHHHVTEDLTDGDGYPTGGTFGFLKGLGDALDKLEPAAAMVFWDGGSDPWRRSILPEYRVRKEKNEDKQKLADWHAWAVEHQVGELKKLLPMIGVPFVQLEKHEADDLIYVAARHIFNEHDVVIVSGDKDFLQLVDEHTVVYDPMAKGKKRDAGTLITESNFKEATGLPTPRQFLQYRSIVGDDSDKIPGPMGVGEKTAKKLFEEFGTVGRIVGSCREQVRAMKHPCPKAVTDEAIQIIIRNLTLMDLSKRPISGREGEAIVQAYNGRTTELQLTEVDEYSQEKNAFDFSANVVMWSSPFEQLAQSSTEVVLNVSF